jgi:phosphoglycerate dehydrogenase-like enzyme
MTLGIVGYGRIGTQVRRLLRPFDMNVLVDDPYIDQTAFAADDVRFVSLEEVLSESDIITLHVPLTEETRNLINQENLPLVKPGSVLINTARGGVVESLDLLYEALIDERLAGVGLDVFPEEPPDPSHPIFSHPRAVLTGHVAARTPISQRGILETMLQEVKLILSGEQPNLENVVNPELYTHRG